MKFFARKLVKLYFKSIFCKYKNYDSVCIFDIDNTIANTWPSFNKVYKNTNERLLSLEVFSPMIEKVHHYYKTGHQVLFLTARSYRSFYITKKWLKKHGIYKSNLIIVNNPMEKIELIKSLNKSIIYYDDMSYNHENGEVKFYDECIREIDKMKNIKYYGYKEIRQMQEGKLNDA